MQKMYPAVVNSPKTELVAAITETDTEIEVADISVLLQSEGLAVIGNGEGAETVKYTSVAGNVLKGCIRGFQGVAKPWAVGTRLARNFTAYDHDAFKENVEAHDSVITDLKNRLDTSDTDPVTLQPGMQVVNAAKDARFHLGEIKGKTEINGQGRIGIIGVENPYMISTSDNLLPPFYEWTLIGKDSTILAPYEHTQAVQSAEWSRIHISVTPNTDYVLSIEGDPTQKVAVVTPKTDIYTFLQYGRGGTFNTREYTEIAIYINGAEAGTIRNITLLPGTAPKPFEPQHKSMLAFQTELHANPSDGSDPDVLFERDGQYFKLAKWGNNETTALAWEFAESHANHKIVKAHLGNALSYSEYVTKYDGKLLTRGNYGDLIAASDKSWIDGFSNIQLSVSNADTGWGPDYNPTQDEIKAYFMGWKMYDTSSGASPYNRTDGQYKGWATVIGFLNGVGILPTTQASNWAPYQLLYRLAKDTVDPILSEGCLTLTEGDNLVEVGSGIVLRERANPVNLNNQNTWAIVNHIGAPGSALTYKLGEFVYFYKDDKAYYGWGVRKSPTAAFGNAYLDRPWSEFDQSAAYSVTYLKLDKSPIQPITGSLAANEKAQISDLTAGVAEALHRVSVVEQKKADKDVPAWITPTLLNGWVNYDLSQYDPVGFYKDSFGEVHLRGMIGAGAVTPGTTLFRLPAGYRPKKHKSLQAMGSNDGNTVSSTFLVVTPLGEVMLMRGANNGYLSLCIPTFLAEQ